MQITKISNQTSFNGICINSSKMNTLQKNLSRNLLRSTVGHMSWDELTKKGIDVIVLPKKDNEIYVRYINSESGSYFRNLKKQIIETIDICNDNIIKKSDEILDTIKIIANGGAVKPEVNRETIFYGKTSLLKMNPKLHKNILEMFEEFKSEGIKPKQAKQLAVDAHLTNIPKEGYNFNF